ncbi:MAG: beta-ketoacyl-ACP synthase, partial [Amphritea sp.]|nr:beta-ketoacyl-ACP synthase [Amphritea sp.]
MKRVVVTGMAGFSPIGNDWQTISESLSALKTGIVRMDEWDIYEGLNTRLAAPVLDFTMPSHYKRKDLRSMGRVAQFGVYSTERALADAGLLNSEKLGQGQVGIAFGSSAGDTKAFIDFGNMLINHSSDGLNANSYVKMMAHTAPVNIGVYFGIRGRVITTSSACTSGSQGIGYAYESIKYGMQQVMVAGGSEGLCATEAAVFDTLFATSVVNDTPELSPRPFDKGRDGLVIGEGGGTLILEELEHALN